MKMIKIILNSVVRTEGGGLSQPIHPQPMAAVVRALWSGLLPRPGITWLTLFSDRFPDPASPEESFLPSGALQRRLSAGSRCGRGSSPRANGRLGALRASHKEPRR